MESAAQIMKGMDRQQKMTAAAGIGSIVFGLTRKSMLGKLIGIVPGVYLGAQAYAQSQGQSVKELVARGRTSSAETVVRIERSPQEVYEFVRDFKNMPKFMMHTHDVREDEHGRVHWVVKAMNGFKLEYDGEVVDDEPGKVLTYRSAPEEPFEETGSLMFEPEGENGTRLTMRVAWTFPGTIGGTVMTKVLEPMTDTMLATALSNLKRLLEAQKKPTAGLIT